MCPYGDHEDGTGSFDATRQGMMNETTAYKVIDEARSEGAMSIKLNFRGEPGLSKNLAPMVRFAKKVGYTEIAINTNLTAFSPRRIKDLADAGLDLLIVSADGATQQTYESIRKGGEFYKLISRLRYVMNLPKRPKVRIQMVAQKANRHEIPLAVKLYGRLSDEFIVQNLRQDNTGERKRCPQPWQRLVIMHDGQVGACCSNWNNEAVIGRYPDDGLKEIWEGKARQALLATASDPNKGNPCKGCLVGGSYR